MNRFVTIAYRGALATVGVIALAQAARYNFGVSWETSKAFEHCDRYAPELSKDGVAASLNVVESAWPYTPICEWTLDGHSTSTALLDWSYTWNYYGALAVAAVAALAFLVIEGVRALLRARRGKQQLAPT